MRSRSRPGSARRPRTGPPRAAGRPLRSCALALLTLLAVVGARPAGAGDAGDSAVGKPLIRNYHHREFGAEVQNWDVVQHNTGLLYFANNAGVLEFDGRSWRIIELPSRLDVQSLVLDPAGAGRIYVGALGDFGYLGPDAVGRLTFRSLLPPEARTDRSFDQPFRPAVTAEGIFFQARTRLCQWAAERLECRATPPALSKLFAVGGRTYVQTASGLMELSRGTLRPVPGGARFTGAPITVLLSYAQSGGGSRLLVGTQDFHLYLQDGDTFAPFAPATRDPRLHDELLSGVALRDGTFVLTTQLRGVLIIDRDGVIRRRIDSAAGLQENHVHAAWPDRDGGLWLALQNGISRVDLGSPFAAFDEHFGLQREWRDVVRIGDMLYVRGYKGLFAADLTRVDGARGGSNGSGVAAPPPGAPLRFAKLEAIEAPVWAFLPSGDTLLVTSKDGIYEVRGTRARRIATMPTMPRTLHRSRVDTSRVFVGLTEGVASLRQVDGVWRNEGRIDGVSETITSMAEGRQGSLWLVSQRQRVLRVDVVRSPDAGRAPADRQAARTRVSVFGRGELSGRIQVRDVAGRLLFLAQNGVFEFDEASSTFVASALFQPLAEAGRRAFSWIAESARGDLWVASRTPGAVDVLRRQSDGTFALDAAATLLMPVWTVYPEPGGRMVWLAASDHLLRYDPLVPRPGAPRFPALIRQVTVNEGEVVFGGADAIEPRLRFPYRSNSVHFEFAAPRFVSPEQMAFQSFLEGFDNDWSGWTREPARSYTNLPSGMYRFHVRARDAGGVIGEEAVFTFTVLRPWYRSWTAYSVYAILLAGTLVVVWKGQLRRAQFKLERDLQHRELEKLRELDRMKSRIFADISHEFRTPLTLILGPVTQMLEQLTELEVRRKLHLVRRNAEYMLRLISQLLDLSKVESGRMRLQASREDLVSLVKAIVAPFSAVAERQEIDLRVEGHAEPGDPGGVIVHVDCDVLEKILNNLLANAIKFTPRGGAVRVGVRSVASTHAEIAVTDTGIGVPAAQLPHIFHRFYQADNGRSQDGIGIGLALVKELVELHGGTISVTSQEGRGSTFTVRLPKGTAHLKEDEILADEPRQGEKAWPMPPIADIGVGSGLAAAGDESESSDDETTVLVVEDHDEVRAFLRDHLRAHYRVLEARSGEDALDIALARLPDLVLSDVMMGGMNGFALCRALKTNEKTGHIPVVLLTARAGQEDKLAGLDTGADCYLVKPFDSTELFLQVKNLIEQRRFLRARFAGTVVLKPSEMAVASVDEVFLSRVSAAVQAHLGDASFDVEQLGREVGLSRSQLHRKLRALTNQSPTLLIRSIRLERASELLRQNAGSVAEIAYQVGFSSQAYFTKCFREQFGCTPKEFAQNGGVSAG